MPLTAYADDDYSGWFDGKPAPSNFYTSSPYSASNFNKSIDNNIGTSNGFYEPHNIVFSTPVVANLIKVYANMNNPIIVKYSDGTVQSCMMGLSVHEIVLDSTKTVKSINIPKGWTISEFDLVVISDFYITSVIPSNGRVDVALDDTIKIYFNKSIDSVGKIILRDSKGNIVSGAYSSSNNVCEFFPKSTFIYGETYTIEVVDFIDSLGNVSPSFISSFTTVKDTIPISVIDIKPPPDSVDVPIDTKIAITFNKKNIDINSFDDVYIKDVLTTKQLLNGVLYLTIKEPLEYQKDYYIHIDKVRDVEGNTMESPIDVKFSTVKDTTGLVLKSYKPPGGIYPLDTEIEFNFNKNVDSRTLKYSIVDGDGNNVSCDVNVVGTKIVFRPILLNSKKYTFVFSEIQDFNSNTYNKPVTINFETMSSSGQKDLDNITSSGLELISFVKEHGLLIVLAAILLGLIFVSSRWLWKKFKVWLASSGK